MTEYEKSKRAKLNDAYKHLDEIRDEMRTDISIDRYSELRDDLKNAESELRYYLTIVGCFELAIYGHNSLADAAAAMQHPYKRPLMQYFGYPH